MYALARVVRAIWFVAGVAIVKKLLGFVVLALIVAGAISIMVTSPDVQRRIKEEKRAKQEAAAARQQEWEQGWKKWMEEAKRKTDERVKQANEPGFDDGFRLGFMGGRLTRSKTNIAVPPGRIEALANEQIEKQGIPAESQAGFVRGFTAGWSFGWTST